MHDTYTSRAMGERRLRNARWEKPKCGLGQIWLIILLSLLAFIFVILPAYRLIF